MVVVDYYKRDLSELKMDMEMRDRFAGMQQDDVQVPSITQYLAGLMRGADVGKCESTPLAMEIVNRHDMLPQQSEREKSNVDQDAVGSSAWLQLRSMAWQRDMADVSDNAQGSGMGDYVAKDGGYMDNITYAQQIREHRRVEEVRQILRSTDLTIMEPLRRPLPEDAPPDFDNADEQRFRLELHVRKRFAAPVGRGAFTLNSMNLSDHPKELGAPIIRMTGKIFGECGAKVNLQVTDPSMYQWGDFHNGVSTGLKDARASSDQAGDASNTLIRAWIVNHRPDDPEDIMKSPSHAGVLFALGLNGYHQP